MRSTLSGVSGETIELKAPITLAFCKRQLESCAVNSFFTEIRRRKVATALPQLTASWLGSSSRSARQFFPAWELPFWCLRLAILLVSVGFPIALLLGWAFEITPTGIHATADTPRPSSMERPRRRGRSLLLLAAVGLVVSLLAVLDSSPCRWPSAGQFNRRSSIRKSQ